MIGKTANFKIASRHQAQALQQGGLGDGEGPIEGLEPLRRVTGCAACRPSVVDHEKVKESGHVAGGSEVRIGVVLGVAVWGDGAAMGVDRIDERS